MINIFVVCGSGVVIFMFVVDEVKLVCVEYGIMLFKINKCSMVEFFFEMVYVDIVFIINNYKGDIGKLYMSVVGFVMGINEGVLCKKLGELLIELVNS